MKKVFKLLVFSLLFSPQLFSQSKLYLRGDSILTQGVGATTFRVGPDASSNAILRSESTRSFLKLGSSTDYTTISDDGIMTARADASWVMNGLGLLIPRFTTTARDANIISPYTGLMIFNTTAVQAQYWNGAAWVGLGSGGSGGSGVTNAIIPGNAIFLADTATIAGGVINFSSAIAPQTRNTVFGTPSGSGSTGAPSFVVLDSSYFATGTIHSAAYNDAVYLTNASLQDTIQANTTYLDTTGGSSIKLIHYVDSNYSILRTIVGSASVGVSLVGDSIVLTSSGGGGGGVINTVAVGNTPNTAGFSYNSGTGDFKLQPADSVSGVSYPGVIVSADQTFGGGKKTFTRQAVFNGGFFTGTRQQDANLWVNNGTSSTGAVAYPQFLAPNGAGTVRSKIFVYGSTALTVGSTGENVYSMVFGTDTLSLPSSGSVKSINRIGILTPIVLSGAGTLLEHNMLNIWDTAAVATTNGSWVIHTHKGDNYFEGGLKMNGNLTTGGLLKFNLGSDATGDILYRNSLGNYVRLGLGTNGQVLASNGTIPVWSPGGNNLPIKRIATPTVAASYAINVDNYDGIRIAAQNTAITGITTSGTPTDGQTLTISITATGSTAITWNSTYFEASTIPLPTTTNSTNRMDLNFVWNVVTSKFRLIGWS